MFIKLGVMNVPFMIAAGGIKPRKPCLLDLTWDVKI